MDYSTDGLYLRSFDSEEKDLNDLNILKLILNTNEEEIYKTYPTRKGNVYAKSIKKIIPAPNKPLRSGIR